MYNKYKTWIDSLLLYDVIDLAMFAARRLLAGNSFIARCRQSWYFLLEQKCQLYNKGIIDLFAFPSI